MSEARIPQLRHHLRRISLFDSNGLPWTAQLSLGWMVFLFIVTGGMVVIPIGLSLGVWIRTKTGSALVLLTYVILAGAFPVLSLVDPTKDQPWSDAVGVATLVLWFAGPFIARHQIARYYAQREGSEFPLSLAFTLLFGVCYLNYRMRPEFPANVNVRPLG
jgi:hypothetical protein